MADNLTIYLALDVGDKRIGVAIANSIARIASPLITLTVDDNIIGQIQKLILDNQANILVLGLPRGLDSQETEQTTKTRHFFELLKKEVNIPMYFIDEAGTSVKAKEELAQRKKPYQKSDVDSLAASYILEDYLRGIN